MSAGIQRGRHSKRYDTPDARRVRYGLSHRRAPLGGRMLGIPAGPNATMNSAADGVENALVRIAKDSDNDSAAVRPSGSFPHVSGVREESRNQGLSEQ